MILVSIGISCSSTHEGVHGVLTSGDPETEGFSHLRLQRIDTALNKWVDDGWMNGAVAMIVRDGRIVYFKSVGYNDVETKTPMKNDGIFRIASQTKAITSVAAMMLFEEGKFSLDDPVSKFIPSFADTRVLEKFNKADSTFTSVSASRQITIRDLMVHRSGLTYYHPLYAGSHLEVGFDVEGEKLSAAMQRLSQLPLMHQPGERFTYGLNTDVLGYLVEIWSGKSLDEFFSERIFGPLAMQDTYFNLPGEKSARLVNMYVVDSTGMRKAQESHGADVNFPLKKKTYFSGGSGLCSTISDYAIFLQMLLNEGVYNEQTLLLPATVRLMVTDQIGDIPVPDWDPMLGVNGFGLGFCIVNQKGSTLVAGDVGTYSWGGGFTTTYWVDPHQRIIGQLYRQMEGRHIEDIDHEFKSLVYAAIQSSESKK